jgi:phage head maturation protease
MSATAIGVRDAASPADPTLVGHFAHFDWIEINSQLEGRFRERFARGAFERTLTERIPKVLFQHGRDPQIGDKPLGLASVAREDDEGAYYEVPLFASVPGLLVDGLRSGAYGASFRFSVVREDVIQRPGVSAENPDAIPERTITEARVMEFGPVTWPAYEGASAGIRSLAEEVGCECRDGSRSPSFVLHMLKGTTRVTPTTPLTVTFNGRSETLRPDISRLAVDHELVRKQPHRFRPADPTDTATRSRLRAKHATRAGNGKPLKLPGRAFRFPCRDHTPVLPARTRHRRLLP